MSSRTNVTVRDQSIYPEVGAAVRTWESCDVTNGNKMQIEERVVVVVWNSSVAAKTVTLHYDDDAGQVSTKVLTLAAAEVAQLQFASRLGRHAADAAEAGFAWLTANGVVGDVKMQATRHRYPLN